MYCRNFIVLSSFFGVKKQRPTMNLKKSYQSSVCIEIFLDLKVYFSLVTCKINNLTALCSTNQITEISASWWLPVPVVMIITFENCWLSCACLFWIYSFSSYLHVKNFMKSCNMMEKRCLFHKSAFKMIGTINSGKYHRANFLALLWTYERITLLA